jgi:excisionase family DNA binding protein
MAQAQQDFDRLYAVKEVADILGFSRWTVYKEIRRKRLKARRPTGNKKQCRLRITREALNEYIARYCKS